jgi:hypothetical protein
LSSYRWEKLSTESGAKWQLALNYGDKADTDDGVLSQVMNFTDELVL